MAASKSESEESGPPYGDNFGVKLDDNEKHALLTAEWDKVHTYTFPSRYAQGRFRTLQAKYFTSYPWLRYSVGDDGVYCAPCHIFAGSEPRSKTLVKHLLQDWSNAVKVLGNHAKSEAHMSQCEAADNFMAVMEGKKKDIECCVSSHYNSVVEKNRKILVSIVEGIIFCGKQNIALRGHDDGSGNFVALLRFQAKHDAILNEHLVHGDPRSKYLSPNIQNEIIGICGRIISDEIVNACNQSQCFGFIADEATDASTMEQMALCLRYYDISKHELCEDLIGFAECKSTTGESLADAFIDNLQRANVQIMKMRGQGYDGAANMSGIHRGVQARIRAIIPGAVYTHCKAHSLNLAIIHASKEAFARNMMDIVQTIAFAFNYSAKRLLRFQENLNNDGVCREEMDRRTKLQSLCETRWAARSDALHTFLSSFRVVVESLDELASNYGDTKAAGYSMSIQNFSFIITLVAVEHVLSAVVGLSKLLQDKSCDLIEAAAETRVVRSMLQAERDDDHVWSALYDKAVSVARDVDVEPSVPRRIGRQCHRPNAPAETHSQYWKTNMYLPFLDHLLSDLEVRLLQGHGRYNAQYLLPTKTEGLTNEMADEIYDEFHPDLVGDRNTFVRECQRWAVKWTVTPPTEYTTLEKALEVATEAAYPDIRRCIMILLCMPVATATAERSFSTMRRVKTYLRSTMSTERMSGLGLLNIYRDREIDAEHVVDIIARKRDRRLALLFKE